MAEKIYNTFSPDANRGEPTPNKVQSPPEEAQTPSHQPGELHIAPVPENLLNTTNALLLQMSEDVAGSLRAFEARIGDVYLPGKFDAAHLRDVHAHVMQDIYPLPGATRGDELLMAKAVVKANPNQTLPPNYDTRIGASGQPITLLVAAKVNERLEELSGKLAAENTLGGLEKPEFVTRLADYYTHYSHAAPFQAGNEHVLNVVINQIGVEAGYVVEPSAAKNLREVTDSVLVAGVESDKSRLIQVLASVTKEGEGRRAELLRDPTQRVIPLKDTPQMKKG
ncbi:MAG: hypothetical protein ACRYG7_02765 [Janthinobacterium lividum]